jgi:thiamine pyrophosphokinase
MDSVDTQLLDRYPKDSIIRYPTAKDYTDTELAMQEVIKKGCQKIWIIGGGGGRLDHLFGIRSLFERDIFPCRWITDKEDIYCLEKGEHHFSVDAGETVSVFPLGDNKWEVTSERLKWPLDNIKWNRGFFGLCNIAIDDVFKITVQAGRFMLIIPLEVKLGG